MGRLGAQRTAPERDAVTRSGSGGVAADRADKKEVFVTRPTRLSLRPFVARVGYSASAGPPSAVREAVMPSGRVNVMVNIGGSSYGTYGADGLLRRHAAAIVGGATDTPTVIRPEPGIGVWADFRPAMAGAFVGSAGALDDVVDLEALWGAADTEQLRATLAAGLDPNAALVALEDALVAHLDPDRVSAPLAAAAGLLESGRSVGEVSSMLEVSPRRFGRLFHAQVGLAPKAFSRVQRFQRLLGLAAQAPSPDWAQLAAEAGYYDQAHLINDFRRITGVTPRSYLRAANRDHPNHMKL